MCLALKRTPGNLNVLPAYCNMIVGEKKKNTEAAMVGLKAMTVMDTVGGEANNVVLCLK